MLFMAPPCESEGHLEGQAQRHALPRFDEVAVMPVTFLQLLLALSRKMVQTSDDRARRARPSRSCVPELASVAVGQETDSPRQEVPSHLLQRQLVLAVSLPSRLLGELTVVGVETATPAADPGLLRP